MAAGSRDKIVQFIQGYVVDAKLAHFAHGYDVAKKLQSGQV